LADKREHVTSDVSRCKASASVREEIMPFAFERVVVSAVSQGGVVLGNQVLCKVGVEPSPPFAECAWVVCEDCGGVSRLLKWS
jgi:hypothetical protein